MFAYVLSVFATIAHADAEQIAEALDLRLTYPSSLNSGRRVHVRHCAKARHGCRERLEAFAGYFVEAGTEYGVSPWLLAAIAVQESRLNPHAEGHCGKVARCRGIMQIHERWRGAPQFIRSEKARARCSRSLGACQAEVVSFAASLLRRQIDRCGSTGSALTAYNTGRCGDPGKYARRILREQDHLRGLATKGESGTS